VAGAISERALLDDIFTGKATMTDPIAEFVGAPLGLIGVHESVSAARSALAGADAVLVVSDGKPVGVLTRQDLLTFLTA